MILAVWGVTLFRERIAPAIAVIRSPSPGFSRDRRVALLVAPLLMLLGCGIWYFRRSRAARAQLLEAQHAVLKRIAAGAPLKQSLEQICRFVEELGAPALCSVVLLDSERQHIFTAAAPSLPESYCRAIDGAAIGPAAGSCGTAIWRRATVGVVNIAVDPLWADFRELALAHRLQACWSRPIFAADGQVLGSFAVYYRENRQPGGRVREIIEVAAEVAAVAIEKARADEQLSLSRTRLELSQRIANLGLWEVELRTRRAYWSPEFRRMFGLQTNEEPSKEAALAAILEEDREHVLRSHMSAVKDGQTVECQCRVRHPDGSIRYLIERVTGIQGPDGQASYLAGVVQDETERHAVLTRWMESERRFHWVAEQTGYLIFEADLDSGEVRWTGATRQIAGVDPLYLAQVKLHEWRRWIPADEVATVVKALDRLSDEGALILETQLLRPDGRTLPIEIKANRLNAGASRRMLGAISDISHRKQADAERRMYVTRLTALANAAREVNSQHSLSELLRLVAVVARELASADLGGVLMAAKIGHEEEIVFSPPSPGRLGDAALFKQQLQCLSEEQTAPRSMQPGSGVAKADEAASLRVMRVALRTRDGEWLGVIGVWKEADSDFTDMDERVLLQLADMAAVGIENAQLYAELEARVAERTRELEASNRELEAFSYSVSHDLRGPLRAIAGFVALLEEEAAVRLGDQGKHYLERIAAATARMGALIDDLLQLSRMSQLKIERSELDLSALAAQVGQRLPERFPERQVQLEIQPGLKALCDSRLLEVVLDNLLDNAWKFTRDTVAARIVVGARWREGERQFFVSDNGVGFDPRYASNLFGVFQRLHSFAEFPGTGVGLATVQRIVQRHGGRVWAEAEVGRGATIFFTLPEGAR